MRVCVFWLILLSDVDDSADNGDDVSEKEKWDAKEKRMTETICHRDGRIEELERQCQQHSDEAAQLAARFGIDVSFKLRACAAVNLPKLRM